MKKHHVSETNLAKWVGPHRSWLINQLAEKVKPSPGAERKFFDELLRRMVVTESPSERHLAPPIVSRDAGAIMSVRFNKSADQSVSPVAHRLRKKIDAVSKLLDPCPKVYLSRAPYVIEVENHPPVVNKKYPEPCIGLVPPDATDWFVGDVIKGVLQMCQGRYDLIVEVSNYSQQAEAKSINRLAERVSGVLVVPVGDRVLKSAIKTLQDGPCVLIDRYFLNVPNVPCVHPADRAAGRFAASHLKKLGCERVLVVDQGARANEAFSITPLKERQQGCIEADEELDVRLLPQAGTDEEGGFEALRHFEAEDGPIRKTDGIFALADHVAVGCHSYLGQHHKDWTIPVLSVEGQRFGDFTQPPLVSIKFGNFEMGRLAAEILIAKIEGKTLPNGVKLPHTEISPVLLTPKPGSTRREETLITVD